MGCGQQSLICSCVAQTVACFDSTYKKKNKKTADSTDETALQRPEGPAIPALFKYSTSQPDDRYQIFVITIYPIIGQGELT